jgi:hypothetical protein
MLIGAYVQSTSTDISLYAFDDGLGWSEMLVDKRNAGLYPSIALTSDGVAYGTYSTRIGREFSKVKWVRIALPNLTGQWTGADLSEISGMSKFQGSLTVKNSGVEKSPACKAMLWLSDDDQFDAGDVPLPMLLKVRSLKPGSSARIKVRFQYPGSLQGKHLFAVIDPGEVTFDRNLLDNMVAIQLGF